MKQRHSIIPALVLLVVGLCAAPDASARRAEPGASTCTVAYYSYGELEEYNVIATNSLMDCCSNHAPERCPGCGTFATFTTSSGFSIPCDAVLE